MTRRVIWGRAGVASKPENPKPGRGLGAPDENPLVLSPRVK